jgi:hypothetical protein
MILRRKPSAPSDLYDAVDYNVSMEHSTVANTVCDNSPDREYHWAGGYEEDRREGRHTDPAKIAQWYSATTTLRFDFPEYNNYGNRSRNSDFAVEVEWGDVLIAIDKFAAHGNREAQCLQAVLRCIREAPPAATE